jgi:Terpene synthase family 2, C-terminal metal binding
MEHGPGWPVRPDERIELPMFELPFIGSISPFADAVMEHSSRWAGASGLVPGEQAVQRLRRGGIMRAGPRLVPTAPVTAACLVCDWTVFLIVIDDEFDDGRELGARPELARAAISDVVACYRGQDVGAFSFPRFAGIGAAAADLGRRFAALSPGPEWLDRFTRHAEDHLWTKVSEAEQRASGTVLDVPSYVSLRRISSAAYTYADLVEIPAQAAIPARVLESPWWGLMLEAAADVWLGIQDICSCAKEVAAGDDLNLAAVMARGAGRSLQQGIDDAYQWVCGRSADFAAARAQLEALPRELGLDLDAGLGVARYLEGVGLLLGGHLAWNSQDNPRYAQAISPT